MVSSVRYTGALLLVLAASNANPNVCITNDAVCHESRTMKETAFLISEQSALSSTTSQFAAVVVKEGGSDNDGGSANATPLIAPPASMIDLQHLIDGTIERARPDASQIFVPSSTDTRWKSPWQKGMSGAKILAQYGLQLVPTPATGNCQYYAVAMSLLDISFDTSQHVEALEHVAQLLKEGIAEASRHGYAVEFPHDIRQAILVSAQLDVDAQEIMIPESEEESDLLFQRYIDEIAESPSAISTYLPTELWGTEVTLRMMAKFLQKSIFVVIAPRGLQMTVGYQVYKPERLSKLGRELDSAEEYYFADSEFEQWLVQLQQACEDPAYLPIVLLYSNFHYSRVQFI